MKTLLSYVLHRLHSLETPIIRHRDLGVYPPGDIAALKHSGLLTTAPEADEIRHPHRPSSGQMVAVRRTKRGRFAVAPEDEDDYFDPIPVSDDEVVQYGISIPKLVQLIRDHNDITGDWEANAQGVMPVGQKHLDRYGIVPVYLSLPNYCPSDFSARCRALRKPAEARHMVVLLPSSVALSSEEHELLNARGITLVALAPLADKGNLTVDWETLWEAPRAVPEEHPPETPTSTDGPVIDETAFSVSWRGREPIAIGNKKEFRLLQELAKSANRYVAFADLAERLGGDAMDEVRHVKSRLVKILRDNGYDDLAERIKTQKGHYGLFLS